MKIRCLLIALSVRLSSYKRGIQKNFANAKQRPCAQTTSSRGSEILSEGNVNI